MYKDNFDSQRSARAGKAAQAAKNAISKTRQTTATGKIPRKQLAMKAPQRQGAGQVVKTKPHCNYVMIALREIRRFQKNVDLLIHSFCFSDWYVRLHKIVRWILGSRAQLY